MNSPLTLVCPSFYIFTAPAITTSCRDFDGINNKLTGILHSYWTSFQKNMKPLLTGDDAFIACYSNYGIHDNTVYKFCMGIEKEVSKQLVPKQIPAGKYICFSTLDSSQAGLVQLWNKICIYFHDNQKYQRAYTVDFEKHTHDKIEIYIACL